MKYFVFLAKNTTEIGEPTRKAGSPNIYSLVISLYSPETVISLYSPETHPTWLPIFTACQPLKALATYSSVVPGATAEMRLQLFRCPGHIFFSGNRQKIAQRSDLHLVLLEMPEWNITIFIITISTKSGKMLSSHCPEGQN